MDTIFRGDLATPRGRRNAWADSLLIDHAALRLVWTNLGTVVPGRLYRSNHPTPGRIAAMARRLGLRTLVNLRGATANGSDALAREAAARHGLAFVDAPLRSRVPPRPDAILHLLDVFAGMAEPALLYCKSGADRTGFAAGLYLLRAGRTAAEARAQLSARHGHLSGSRAGVLGAVLAQYASEGEGRVDFSTWVRTAYDPDALAHAFTSGRVARVVHERLLARE